jgi:acyl-CoA thioester hydrolase
MAEVFRTRRRVEFAETDMAGMVHFSNFFRYMEAAEVEYLRSLGLSVALEWEGKKVSFPRVAASCDFSKPARFEDVIDIAVSVKKVGRTSVTYGFEVTRDGELLARGQVSTVCCSVDPGRPLTPMELPPPLREKLQQALTA